jgi:hypothetical protein
MLSPYPPLCGGGALGMAGIQKPYQHGSSMGSLAARLKHSGMTDP